MLRQFAIYSFCILVVSSCRNPSAEKVPAQQSQNDSLKSVADSRVQVALSRMDLYLDSLGLVNVLSLDSMLRLNIRYSSTANFTGKDLYGEYNSCYLQKDVAEKLIKAHAILRTNYPYYRFLIFDGARPVSVQQLMWDSVDLSPSERQKYLSNPGNYSLHNFGAAVDLTIIDDHGRELDMGTPYDYFGTEAHPRSEQTLYSEGKLTASQIINREILRDVMRQAGFTGIETEWWHFNSCSRIRATEIYTLVK